MTQCDDLEALLLKMSEAERIQLGQEIFAESDNSSLPQVRNKKSTLKPPQTNGKLLIEQAQQDCGQALEAFQLNLLRDVLTRR